ncbi:hypothetical protein [Methylomonas methanica]|uniref:Uncharacterized protein n=1 Tax=Methylomonas methanica (strain DSM 25384 / MC09) TaxID=857087 RepID=G0A6Y1_METMM|nr:hypothetical protein [Methylomonas methanica]AEG01775.1 hypothetical protein Metme_3404 [Methylomonas methanica MC09]
MELIHSAIIGMTIVIPTILIYKKAGLNPLWAALVFLPIVGLLAVFMQLCFQSWPNSKRGH